jgi:hypothetical protein
MSVEHVAVGWARRPNGGNLYRATLRHLHVAGSARTVCGVPIPGEVLNTRSQRQQFAGLIATLSADEIAREPACIRCYASPKRKATE